ncbi:hypothetical protein ACVB8X_14090 [Streptomyces sp. NRAIS4]
MPNPTLNSLTQTQTLAQIETDLAPVLDYVSQTLGIDLASVLKAVEFSRPAESQARQIDTSTTNAGELPHLVPESAPTGPILEISQKVEGLIARSAGELTFDPGRVPSTVTAAITKSPLIAGLPQASLNFRVLDEAGNLLTPGGDYFATTVPFLPDFVFPPVFLDAAGPPRTTVRRNVFCDVAIAFTPVGGVQERISRVLGPVPLDLLTTRLETVAVLTEHAIGDSRFPGRVLVAVPANSGLGDAGAAFAQLEAVREILVSVGIALWLLGIALPVPLSTAIRAITIVANLTEGRFRKGDLIGFYEWPWDNWQEIFSAVFMVGPTSRSAVIGGLLPQGVSAFRITPGPFSVVAIPDLQVYPLAPTAGFAEQLRPPLPARPPGGTFNDNSTSIHFF